MDESKESDERESTSSVFLTYTPYNVLLSYAIAKENDRNYLLATGEEPGLDLIKTIESHSSSPFDDIVFLPEKERKDRLRSALNTKRTIDMVSSWVRDLDDSIQKAHVFHKDSSEAEALLYILNESDREFRLGTYVEDGVEAYSTHEFGKKSLPVIVLGKLLFGFWWKNAQPLYSSEYVNFARAIFPDQLRPSLRNLPKEKISAEALRDEDSRDMIAEYFAKLDVDIPENIDLLLIAPHSNLAEKEPELIERIESAISNLDHDANISIKYHPRDRAGHYLDVNGSIIPSEVPIESIYIHSTIGAVVGGRSTAILTARWLTDAKVRSIYLGWDQSDKRIESTLEKIGVKSL